MALQYSTEIQEEQEILDTDITQEFYNSLDIMIKEGYLIKINMNGDVRTSKSTTK